MSLFGVTDAKDNELRERMAALGVVESDLKETFVRSGGPGGQKVNRSATCVRLLHLPTLTEVKMQKTRSQPLNRYYARKRLCEMLEERTLGEGSPAAVERARIEKQKSRRHRRTIKKLKEGSDSD